MSPFKAIRPHATKKAASPLPSSRSLAKLSAQFGVSRRSLRLAVNAAQRLPTSSVEALSRWVELLAALDAGRQGELVAAIAKALEAVTRAKEDDPLEAVDEQMRVKEKLLATIQADRDAQESRRLILRDSVSAEEAIGLSGRSRQNLEAMRRRDFVIALREGHQWRYPVWQFDRDGVGGLVPGIREVLARLRMSPAGVALWFIQPSPVLDGAHPIDLLRQGRKDEVVDAAEQLGYAP